MGISDDTINVLVAETAAVSNGVTGATDCVASGMVRQAKAEVCTGACMSTSG